MAKEKMVLNSFPKPHVVAVPFPALGHSIPFLDLAKLLAEQALIVSYVTTPANVSRLQGLVEEARSSCLDIRLVALPTPVVEGLPEGLESADMFPTQSLGLLLALAQKLAEPFNGWFEQQLIDENKEETCGPPICIISDVFIGWTVESAAKYGVPRVIFNTCGAFGTSLMHSVGGSILDNTLQTEGDSVVLSNLPSPLRLQRNEIPPSFFEQDFSKSARSFSTRQLQRINESSGMLVNTFEELEPLYLQHLKNVTAKPVWSIGPLLPPSIFSGEESKVMKRGKLADVSRDRLLQWLDSQRPRSVLYVSFGSQTFLSEEQSQALARGLEGSQQPFIWSLKVAPHINPDMSVGESDVHLPEGFEERIEKKGLIIRGWAPQLLILSHPSIGGFMTHCGWNSTLESITLGLPLITWPMFGDQHFNSKQVAEQLGIGVQFCQHREGIPSEERVKDVVRLVLVEEEGEEMRKRAEKVKEMARKAVDDDGSSRANVDVFIKEMLHFPIINVAHSSSLLHT